MKRTDVLHKEAGISTHRWPYRKTRAGVRLGFSDTALCLEEVVYLSCMTSYPSMVRNPVPSSTAPRLHAAQLWLCQRGVTARQRLQEGGWSMRARALFSLFWICVAGAEGQAVFCLFGLESLLTLT